MFVNFNILNQLGSPAINSNTFANRPAAGQTGRLFVSTDTFEIYRDNGTTWDLIGGPGSSTITGTGTATQVAYFTSSQAIGSSANLYWDNTNNNLLVGSSISLSNSAKLQINGNTLGTGGLFITGRDALNAGALAAELGVDKVGTYGANTTVLGSINRSVIPATFNPMALEFTTLKLNFDGIVKASFDTNGSLAIGTAAFANTSSILDLVSTDQGFLQPRMTTAQRNAIATPATGLTVYNTSSNTIDYYNGTSWISLSTTTGTVTGTGTATQVAFWSASSTISGSNNLYWDNVTGSLGVNTNTPGAKLDVHGTGTIAQFNTTAATGNVFLAIQRSGTGLWRIGDTYNGGSNYFELHNTVLNNNAIQVLASSNEATFLSSKTYSTGNAIGVAVQHNLTIPNAVNVGLAAIGGVNSNLNLTLGGSTTVAATGRQGLEGSTTINFTGAGTLTMTQGSTVRAFSAISSVYAFNSSAVGTITHLAGLRICFPDNPGSAVNITNNYALLINNQTTGTGTVTYTNRWGIYQEGASDLNYMAANLLLGSTVNTGDKLQVTGYGKFWDSTQGLTIGAFTGGSGFGAIYAATVTPSSINHSFAASSSATILNVGTGGVIDLEVNTVSALYINSSRNVGIGTTSPGTRLEASVSRTNGTNVNVITLSDNLTGVSTAGFGTRIQGLSNVGSVVSAIGFENGGTGTNNESQLSFYTQNTAGSLTRQMMISSTGNVGIGTTSPAALTEINPGAITNGGAAKFALAIRSGGTTYLDIYQGNNSTIAGQSILGSTLVSSDALAFATNNAERMRITSGGNVLIGTTTDAGQKLQVAGTVATTSSITTGAPSGGTAAAWKLGSRVAATVALDTTQYIELDVGGTLYKLAIVT